MAMWDAPCGTDGRTEMFRHESIDALVFSLENISDVLNAMCYLGVAVYTEMFFFCDFVIVLMVLNA